MMVNASVEILPAVRPRQHFWYASLRPQSFVAEHASTTVIMVNSSNLFSIWFPSAVRNVDQVFPNYIHIRQASRREMTMQRGRGGYESLVLASQKSWTSETSELSISVIQSSYHARTLALPGSSLANTGRPPKHLHCVLTGPWTTPTSSSKQTYVNKKMFDRKNGS